MLSSPLIYTILSFTIIMIVIYRTKPKVIFNGNQLKEFGIGNGKSILPFPVIAMFIAIIIYFTFFYIDKNNLNNNINNNLNLNHNHNHNHNHNQSLQQTQYIYRVVRQAPDGTLLI
jgi:hypothetical protein